MRGTWKLRVWGTLASHFWTFEIFWWMFYPFKKLINNQKVLQTHAGHSSLECPAPFSKFRPITGFPFPTAHVGCPEGRAHGWASPSLRGHPRAQTGYRPQTRLQISLPETSWRVGKETNSSGWHSPPLRFFICTMPGGRTFRRPWTKRTPSSLRLISIACHSFQRR